jgi:hypothetical protein
VSSHLEAVVDFRCDLKEEMRLDGIEIDQEDVCGWECLCLC